MWRGIALMVCIILAMAMIQSCGGRPGAQAGPQDGVFGSYPVGFRDIVQGHIAAAYPSGQVQRNVVVRPPSAGWLARDGQKLAGHFGQVQFSLKDQEQQTFRRVTYCYFLFEDAVLAFEDKEQAGWCVQAGNQEEGR